MKIIGKNESNFPKSLYVIVNNTSYYPDYIIKFEKGSDIIIIKDCVCVFSITSQNNPMFVKFVGAKFYKTLTNENVIEKINGYKPEQILCFTQTDFPLDRFLEENTFDIFTE